MERAFLITKESKLYKDLEKYKTMLKSQKEQVSKFEKEIGIESEFYAIRGNGGINCAFQSYEKCDIELYIQPTEIDIEKFGKMMLADIGNGLRRFRKNSKISKQFQQYCIDNEVVINIVEPYLRDYFKTLGWQRYSQSILKCDELYYLKIESENLKDDDIPDGITPIKMSEYYSKLEEFNANN